MSNQPFHEGEIAVQERAGEREIARRHGAGISSHIVGGALPFLARQRLLAVTVVGDAGHLWTAVWGGQPGFVSSQDSRSFPTSPEGGSSFRSRRVRSSDTRCRFSRSASVRVA